MQFGQVLKTLRSSRSISQGYLANEIDVTQNYISLIESNKKLPSPQLIEKIANYFDVSKSALVIITSEVPAELDENNTLLFRELQKNLTSIFLS